MTWRCRTDAFATSYLRLVRFNFKLKKITLTSGEGLVRLWKATTAPGYQITKIADKARHHISRPPAFVMMATGWTEGPV